MHALPTPRANVPTPIPHLTHIRATLADTCTPPTSHALISSFPAGGTPGSEPAPVPPQQLLVSLGSREAEDAPRVEINVDVVEARPSGQPRHRHDGAHEWEDEAGTSRAPHIADREREALGGTLWATRVSIPQMRARCERVKVREGVDNDKGGVVTTRARGRRGRRKK